MQEGGRKKEGGVRARAGLGLAQRVACRSVNMELSECPLPTLHYSFPGLMGARGERAVSFMLAK